MAQTLDNPLLLLYIFFRVKKWLKIWVTHVMLVFAQPGHPVSAVGYNLSIAVEINLNVRMCNNELDLPETL
jgi:hypothetical protein